MRIGLKKWGKGYNGDTMQHIWFHLQEQQPGKWPHADWTMDSQSNQQAQAMSIYKWNYIHCPSLLKTSL